MNKEIIKRLITVGLALSTCGGDKGPNPVDLYNKAVKDDISRIGETFTSVGTEDLSQRGLKACVLDSDCLVGSERCIAGSIPNTSSMPGYCVPKN